MCPNDYCNICNHHYSSIVRRLSAVNALDESYICTHSLFFPLPPSPFFFSHSFFLLSLFLISLSLFFFCSLFSSPFPPFSSFSFLCSSSLSLSLLSRIFLPKSSPYPFHYTTLLFFSFSFLLFLLPLIVIFRLPLFPFHLLLFCLLPFRSLLSFTSDSFSHPSPFFCSMSLSFLLSSIPVPSSFFFHLSFLWSYVCGFGQFHCLRTCTWWF